MRTTPEALEQHLLRERGRLLAFIRSKPNDPELAEDVLQESLLRALRSAPDLQDEEKVTAWLYQIVRNAITDTYRRRASASRRADAFAAEAAALAEAPEPMSAEPMSAEPMSADDEARACACIDALIPALAPGYAAVVEADLAGVDAATLAERLGVSRGALKVRRHRAHRQLRERLDATCRTCAAHGCVDCTCLPSPTSDPS